ncbi:hypothetical protein, partial [Pseudoalteromonas sp. SIMBA_162]|uniref:hypothetical protein n=1 Tax=Pseudoalteromonas sp. SIMBA_162 TaxID=3080867 RepID=UPI003979A731
HVGPGRAARARPARRGRCFQRATSLLNMKIAILDDYQDAVRKLNCFEMLAEHDVKVFNNTVRGLGQLASRLAEVEAL